MEGLKKGDSIFKYIPDDIGEIAYCDSTTPKAERDSSVITSIKILFSISIPIAISVLCWLFNDHSPIINTIATLAMAFISSFCIYESLHFYGKDYFVGTGGYAIIKFNQSRDNITESSTFHFQDFDDMVSGEKEKWDYSGRHRQYIKTIYHYTVYGREDYNQRKVQAHIYDTYRQNNIKYYYSNDNIRFLKMIEEQWTNYKLEMVKEAFNKTASVSFNAYHRDGYINDYITFKGEKGEELIIDGNVYNKDDFNEIYFEDSNLTMVHKNNKGTAFLGLIEKKDMVEIPLHQIANRRVFFMIFYCWRHKMPILAIDSVRDILDSIELRDEFPILCDFSEEWKEPKTLHNKKGVSQQSISQ